MRMSYLASKYLQSDQIQDSNFNRELRLLSVWSLYESSPHVCMGFLLVVQFSSHLPKACQYVNVCA